MDELHSALKNVLADTFIMYFKTHQFHWNVEGPNFPQYHSFLDTLYNELWAATDTIAEHIRAIDKYAPSSLSELISAAMIQEEKSPTLEPDKGFAQLISANNMVLITLMKAYQAAEAVSEVGLSNFLQDRIDTHNKHGWMLKSTAK
jgi:starvation-inducible DNA-binding protein